MIKKFQIDEFVLGKLFHPYIIAEIGVNHGGNLDTAKRLIDDAQAGGAHAAKFQTYKADKIAIKDSPAYWDTTEEATSTQHALFQKYDQFGEEEYIELARHCQAVGIDFLSTPFDLEAADFLAPLMPLYKIASADITNVPLIRKCASHGKPVVLSTGASTLEEIHRAISEATAHGAKYVALLHCILNYPTPTSLAQLGHIKVLKNEFVGHPIGYSDHVVPDETLSALQLATLMGSQILEKHFTHDKSLTGNDHYHAMDRNDLAKFTQNLKLLKELYGDGEKDLSHEKMAILHARRSVVAATNIFAGEALSEKNMIAKRPGHGISPTHWDELVGAIVSEDIMADEPISWQKVAKTQANDS